MAAPGKGMIMKARYLALAGLITGCSVSSEPSSDESDITQRTEGRRELASPLYEVSADDVGFHMDYSWREPGQTTKHKWNGSGGKQFTLGIEDKILDMIDGAESKIVASWFLFDSMYANPAGAPSPEVGVDIVQAIKDRLIAKQESGVQVAVILDPINRAYSDRREGTVQQELSEAGVAIYYSDLTDRPMAIQSVPPEEVARVVAALKGDTVAAASLTEMDQELLARALLTAIHEAHEEGKSYTQFHEEMKGSQKDSYKATLKAIQKALLAKSAIEGAPPPTAGTKDPVQMVIHLDVDALVEDDQIIVGGEPVRFDGYQAGLATVFNAALLKANHRKLLIVDDASGEYEALVSSANPHNASLPSVNSAISVRGEMAKFAFNAVVSDMAHSHQKFEEADEEVIALRSALEHKKEAPFLFEPVPVKSSSMSEEQCRDPATATMCARFVTESKISSQILDTLARVTPTDEVRIQMFYLSQVQIVDAIADVARQPGRVSPVKLLLDPNLDAFNSEKDGSPNRQVADYLKGDLGLTDDQLVVRWYTTSGQQNHAKIMSVTDPVFGCFEMITGSGNWTRKNIGSPEHARYASTHEDKSSPNMEADAIIMGCQSDRSYVSGFNDLFDTFWTNEQGRIFSQAYADHPLAKGSADPLGNADKQATDPLAVDSPNRDAFKAKWREGERSGLVSW